MSSRPLRDTVSPMSTFSVACVQTAPVFGAVEDNLREVEDLLDGVAADVVVLPELFATGYSFRDRDEAVAFAEPFPDGETVSRLCQWSDATGGVVVGGFPERAGDRVFNAAAVVGFGRPLGCYRKAHLFGFEPECFDAGDRQFQVFAHGGVRVGVMICFDWMFPEAARALALRGADVIAHPSNLVTPGWCQQAMKVRAMENMVATATANRFGTEHREPRAKLAFTGESQICGPMGTEEARGPAEGKCVVRAEIDRSVVRLKRFPSGNEILRDRRPDLYAEIGRNPPQENDLET